MQSEFAELQARLRALWPNVTLRSIGEVERTVVVVHSISVRMSRLRSVQLASGANATPSRPTRSVCPSSQSRNRGRCPAFISARARLFISAIFTSAGQAVVHIPHPEQ